MVCFWLQRAVALTVCVLMLATVGCGSGETTAEPTGGPTAKEALADLTNLLKHLQAEGKPPPARLEDILPIEPLFQASHLGLTRNEIVYFWGTPLDPTGGSKVLAYEKAVETGSGWVLMQDGALQTMQASDFQAAPKAK